MKIQWYGIVILLSGMGLTACDFRQEAIGLSNWTVDFSRNETAFPLYVWNLNPYISDLTVELEATEDWILLSRTKLTSTAPADPKKGPFDRQVVFIRIDRYQLNKGEHKGKIRLTSKGIKSKTVEVRVLMDYDGRLDPLNATDVAVIFSKPYLIDFAFGLRDAKNRPVVADPAVFLIEGLEDDEPVRPESGIQLRRTRSRQLKVDLIMDYSAPMQDLFGAIPAMEDVVINTLFPALGPETLIGITVFYRDDQPPVTVADFTLDQPFLRERIRSIQSDIVGGWYSGSRLYDGIVFSSEKFDKNSALQESRYAVVFSTGVDSSSRYYLDEAVEAASNQGIRLLTVGFGPEANLPVLLDLASRTEGEYYPVTEVETLSSAIGEILNHLNGQYTLRWASLKRRNDETFIPSFSIRLGNGRVIHQSKKKFTVGSYKGNVLQAKLQLTNASSSASTAAVLRANYVPRFLQRMRFYVYSRFPFQTSLVQTADDGLIGDWTLSVQEDEGTAGYWIDVQSSAGRSIAFAAFGPLIRFDFSGSLPEDAPLFEIFAADNRIYSQGVSVDLLGFDELGEEQPPPGDEVPPDF